MTMTDGSLLPPEAALLIEPRRSSAPQCLQAALLSHGRGRLLRSGEAVKALQKGFGLDYRQHVDDKLAPDLIVRGLLRREQRKSPSSRR